MPELSCSAKASIASIGKRLLLLCYLTNRNHQITTDYRRGKQQLLLPVARAEPRWDASQSEPPEADLATLIGGSLPAQTACPLRSPASSDRLPVRTACLLRPPARSDRLPAQTACPARTHPPHRPRRPHGRPLASHVVHRLLAIVFPIHLIFLGQDISLGWALAHISQLAGRGGSTGNRVTIRM